MRCSQRILKPSLTLLEPYHVPPLRVKIRVMTLKVNFTFSKAPGLQPHHKTVLCHMKNTHFSIGGGISYTSADMLSMYLHP